jgi:hypothetical protein
VSVVDPRGTAGLDYGAHAALQVERKTYSLVNAPRSVLFPACRGGGGFVGGFILKRPMCIHLRVQTTRVSKLVAFPIGVRSC